MTQDVYSKLLTDAVGDNGTIVFAYAAGRDADDYSSVGHGLYASGLQANFPIADTGIGVSFGETEITVTYKGATTIPAKSKVSLTAVLLEAQEEFGDFTVNDLLVGGEVESPAYLTTTAVGTVTTPATTVVEEHGDGIWHYTKLTLTEFAMGTSGDDAAKAIGAKFYTLPAGDFIIEAAAMVGTIVADVDVPEAANAEVGIGTVIGTGVQATLGAVSAAAENVCGPVVIAAFDDTAVVGVAVAAGQPFLRIAASGGLARDLFLNAAATWADVAAVGAVTFTGVVTLKWRKID